MIGLEPGEAILVKIWLLLDWNMIPVQPGEILSGEAILVKKLNLVGSRFTFERNNANLI